MSFKVFHRSDVGMRKNNEDSYWVLRYTANSNRGTAVDGAIICVCDGMGGLASGEVASSEAITELRNALVRDKRFNSEDIIHAISVANQKLYNLGVERKNEFIANGGEVTSKNSKQFRLGTTCTLLILEEGKYRLFHVGDSRCYQILGTGEHMVLTTDHTAFEKFKATMQKLPDGTILVDGKKKTPKEVGRMVSQLTKSLGTFPNIEVDFIEGRYSAGDHFLISSDGFWHDLSNSRSPVSGRWVPLLQDNPDKALEWVMEQAKSRGEKDNLTATVVRVD